MTFSPDRWHIQTADGVESGRRRESATLQNGLDILELVADGSMSLAELVQRTDLPRATVRRLSLALLSRNLLVADATGRFRPGPKLLLLGESAKSQIDLMRVARPCLQALTTLTGHSTFLGRRDGDYCVHMHRSTGRERVTVMTGPGTRRPLAETSLGRALLIDDNPGAVDRALALANPDYMPAAARDDMQTSAGRGVILSQGPGPHFVNGIASPVRDASGAIVAAISVASAASYLPLDRMRLLAPVVRQAAAEISGMLGHALGAR
ncbi:IclR family transcriptional regulator [Sphingomonas sp. AP4-R1]|uniref:IclR family transcriptional regulator n=1 Tax=Sphingomonas sp. AP4-R1 TaxID=2735134 RepID=UPI0020A2642D|nr:IclR family transcriptional regulator C-terminal domain-containing protein [Sphingomonas sp. AP4-R1]